MQKKTTKRIMIAAGTLGVLGIAASQLPVKGWVETQLIQALEKQGMHDVTLHVERLGLDGVELSDVSIGQPTPLLLKNVTVDYSFSGLRKKTIEGLTLEGLKLEAYQDKDGVKLRGLEGLMASGGESKPLQIPVTREGLAGIPLSRITIRNGALGVGLKALSANVPLDVQWNMQPEPRLRYEANGVSFQAGEIAVHTGAAKIDVSLDEKALQWTGAWAVSGIETTGAPAELPPLAAKGTLQVQAQKILLKGTLADAKNTYHAAFDMTYDFAKKDASALRVSNLRMPWNGGVVGINAATLPLGGNHATRFTLVVEKVSIAALMKSLTGERATGTGVVSGSIPVTISSKGELTLQEGRLRADEPGVIAITPETIPGDNAQITVVRDVLKNLHYSVLSISVNSGKDNALSVLMAVEGKNPDLPQSRPVRLNVQLTGDVLNLLRQNVMSITDPQHLLEKK